MAKVKNKEEVKAKREKVMAIAKGSSGEPNVVDGENYRSQFAKALNYYNAFASSKELRVWAGNWCKANGKDDWLKIVNSKNPDYEFNQIGVVCRLLLRGQFVSQVDQIRVFSKFDEIKIQVEKLIKVDEVAQPVVDKNKILADSYLSDFDAVYDEFFSGNVSNFNVNAFLAGKEINRPVSKMIHDHVQKIHSELLLIDEDEQLAEGYAHIPKRDLNKIKTFLVEILNGLAVKRVASVQKPRAKKIKPVSVQVNKIDVQPSCTVGNIEINGVAPEKLVGAKEVWAWCYKLNNMLVFKSKSGMAVNGSVLTGWEPQMSVGKKIKKPEQFFLNKNMVELSNAFAEIDFKPFPFTGRLNRNIVLFKVI